MVITLNTPKDIPVVEAVIETVTEIAVVSVTDYPGSKLVVADVSLNGRLVTKRLWFNASYDAIGQWTDTDVINRIKELYQI